MWGRSNEFGEPDRGTTAPGARLSAVDAVRAVAGGRQSSQHPDQPQRRSRLDRIARAVGADDLWTFVPVEDDLFLRDCVGAVPGSAEIAAVMDAREARGPDADPRPGPDTRPDPTPGPGRAQDRTPVRGRAGSRRILVYPPRVPSGPVLAAAFPVGGPEPEPGEQRLLALLAQALELAEAPSPADEARAPAAPASGDGLEDLGRQLDALDRAWVRDALDRAGGDRAAAAAALRLSEGELTSRMARLGLD